MKWVEWNIVIFTPLPCDDNRSAIYDIRADPSSYSKKLMGERLNFYKEVLIEKFNLIDLSAEHNALARKLTLTIKSNNILEKDFPEKLKNYLIELAEQAPLQNYKNTNWRKCKNADWAQSLNQPEIPAKKSRVMSWGDICQFLKIVPQPMSEIPKEIITLETTESAIENIPSRESLETYETNTKDEVETEEEIVYWTYEN